jgi:hypothetical protein
MKKYIVVLIAAFAVIVSTAIGADFKAQNLVKTTAGTVSIADNTTTNLPAAVYSDAGLWVNPDGSTANVTLLMSLVGTNANSTNTFTFTLQTVPDGSLVTTTTTTNQFTATLKATGTTRITEAMPIPAAKLVGAKAIRLVSVATDNKSTPGVTTATAKICGFVP